MGLIRWVVLLGTFAIVTSAAAQDLPDPYIEVDNWAQLPAGRTWGTLYAPAVDSHGNVFVLDRCGVGNCVDTNVAPILEFDSSGKYMKSIGQGLFAEPHGLFMDKDDNLWVADAGGRKGKGNVVIKLSPEGKVLLTLGKKGVMGGASGKLPWAGRRVGRSERRHFCGGRTRRTTVGRRRMVWLQRSEPATLRTRVS